MRKFLCVLQAFVVLGMSSVLATAAQATGATTPAKPRVALVMKSLANEFFYTMAQGAKAHQQKQSGQYDLVVNGIKDERDTSGQIKLIEQMIAARVDAIVLAPADSKALVPIVKRALDAGIVVINIDNPFDSAALKEKNIAVPFVGPQDRQGAQRVGEQLGRRLQKGDKVAIIEGLPTAHNARQRTAGFTDAMNAAGMKIVGVQTGEWEIDKANKIAAAMLRETPDLKAILCGNDSMALGAVSAIKSAGKTGKVLVVGYDNISAVGPMLKDGRILATADQHAGKLAVFGIETALKMVQSKTSSRNTGGVIETPIDVITAKN